jgi:hypothetical protein
MMYRFVTAHGAVLAMVASCTEHLRVGMVRFTGISVSGSTHSKGFSAFLGLELAKSQLPSE